MTRPVARPPWGLTLLLFFSAAASTLQPVRSFDFWWHLASGRLMTETGRLLHADPFSFTRTGTPWLDHEWLVQLIGFLGYRAAGEWFPALGTMALAVVAYLLIAQAALELGASPSSASLLLALSLAGIRFRFDPRPEMMSYVFLAALCFLLQSSSAPGKGRRAWLLFPLFALWSNVHPAVLLGGAVAVLWLAGEAVQRRLRPGSVPAKHHREFVVLGSLGAILLNPGGWRLLAIPLQLRRIVASGHAPNLEWGAPSFADFPLLYLTGIAAALLLLLCWAAETPVLRRLASGAYPPIAANGREAWPAAAGELDWPPLLAAALAAILAFHQLRNIGFFFLLLPLALGRPLGSFLGKARLPEALEKALGGSVLALLTLVFLRGAGGWEEGQYLRGVSPSGAVQFLEKNDLGRHLFNDVKFGGYLIWERFPEDRVFIDGRNEVYDSLLAEVFAALGSWERWEALLARYEVDVAMLRRGQLQAVQYPPLTPGGKPRREMRAFSAAYFQPSRWALVFWDDDALIFVRRGDPRHGRVLEKEFRIVNPDDSAHLLGEIRQGRGDLGAALAEVDRKLQEDPRCLTAVRLRRQLASLAAPTPR